MEINRIPHPTDTVPVGIADFGYFYIGGEYVETSGGTVRSGAMYVEYFRAADRKSDHPVVMVHGNWQTGNNFTGTPDGRKGWADYFVEQGYAVYVVDQPARRRGDPATARAVLPHPQCSGPTMRKCCPAPGRRR